MRLTGVGRWLLYSLYCLVVLEVGLRGYWRIGHGVPFWRPSHVALAFYPRLQNGLDSVVSDDRFDVLLLGGSVLYQTAKELERRLEESLEREVLIHNVSVPGHTSLDSTFKYEWLSRQRYDLVVFYHAINDVRANNVPPELFRSDYSHFYWYSTVNALRATRGARFLVMPFTLRYLLVKVEKRIHRGEYVPRDDPRGEWVRYGQEISTSSSFRRSLERIIDLTRDRGEPLLLMTFAWHLAEGYTRDRFLAGDLPYANQAAVFPIEKWGLPENVVAGIQAHNRVIRNLAANNPDVLFVDQEADMPPNPSLFGDICHLSPAGLEKFVGHLVPEIVSVAEGR